MKSLQKSWKNDLCKKKKKAVLQISISSTSKFNIKLKKYKILIKSEFSYQIIEKNKTQMKTQKVQNLISIPANTLVHDNIIQIFKKILLSCLIYILTEKYVIYWQNLFHY